MKKVYFLFVIGLVFIQASAQSIGGKILYSYHNRLAASSQDSIYTIDSAGQKAFVTLGYRPRLSHNGKYLAFSNGPFSNASYGANLWLRDLTTGTEGIIVSNNDYLDYYDFYPSDGKLAYSEGCSIYSVNLDGSSAYTNLNSYPSDCFSDDPTIRVFDSAIAYHNVHYGLFMMNSDGSSPKQLTNTVPGDLFPSWSHSGEWLAYYKPIPGSYNGGAGAYVPTNSVYKINVNTGDTIRLSYLAVNDTLAADPIWSRDDESLYTIGRIGGTLGLYQIQTDGSGTYSRIYTFDSGSVVADYWLGLSDSIKSNIFPVSLLNFTAFSQGKSVQVQWQTAQEINSNYFTVERSTNGVQFSAIATLSAKGNSSNVNTYLFNDNVSTFATATTLQYRLKQVDKDGKVTYSKIVSVGIAAAGRGFIIYPNPTKGRFKIVLPEVNAKAQLQVYDASGKLVYQQAYTNLASRDVQTSLPHGIYLIKIKGDKTTAQQKLVVE